MNSVVIIGAGNVAFHLTRALLENTVNVRQVFNRTYKNAEKLGEANNIKYTNKISELEKAELYIIAASDRAIEELSYFIPYPDALVVHTAGSLGTEVLKGNYRKGIFYPFQTFTKNRVLRYDQIPFFVEAEDENDEEALFNLAKKVSNHVYKTNSEKRLKVHMSGVWVNNFTNHLYSMGEKFCKEADLPFDVLLPLIEETSKKARDLGPFSSQTGPARRNDEIVINKHLEILEEDSRLQQLYKILSESIRRTYNND